METMHTVTVDGALAQYEVADTEVLTNELFTSLVIESRKHSVLNLDLVVPIERAAKDRELLTNAGFSWAGTNQINRDGRAVLFARFRICAKVAGDGIAANGNTTLPPTDMERQAIERMREEMSKPIDEARLRALQEGRSYDDRGNRL
jgi:hypothetical protein